MKERRKTKADDVKTLEYVSFQDMEGDNDTILEEMGFVPLRVGGANLSG